MQNEKLKSSGRVIFGFYILNFSLTLGGCALPQVPSHIVYEDPINFVRLESDKTVLPEWPPSQHSHPFAVSPDEMAGILKGFTVREHHTALQDMIFGKALREPAFRDDEIALLAPRLAEALSQARPDERVTYYLSRPQTSIKREITSGGLYIKGNHMHFILGNHRIIYGIPAYGMVYDRRYPTRPTVAKGFDLFFEPAEAVVQQESGIWDQLLGRAKDEVVIDFRKLHPGKPVAEDCCSWENSSASDAVVLRPYEFVL